MKKKGKKVIDFEILKSGKYGGKKKQDGWRYVDF